MELDLIKQKINRWAKKDNLGHIDVKFSKIYHSNYINKRLILLDKRHFVEQPHYIQNFILYKYYGYHKLLIKSSQKISLVLLSSCLFLLLISGLLIYFSTNNFSIISEYSQVLIPLYSFTIMGLIIFKRNNEYKVDKYAFEKTKANPISVYNFLSMSINKLRNYFLYYKDTQLDNILFIISFLIIGLCLYYLIIPLHQITAGISSLLFLGILFYIPSIKNKLMLIKIMKSYKLSHLDLMKLRIKKLEFKTYLLFLFCILFASCATHNIKKKEIHNKLLTKTFQKGYHDNINTKKDMLFFMARDAELNDDYQNALQYYQLIIDNSYISSRVINIMDFFRIMRISHLKDLNPEDKKKEMIKIYSAWYHYQMGNKNKLKELVEKIEKKSK